MEISELLIAPLQWQCSRRRFLTAAFATAMLLALPRRVRARTVDEAASATVTLEVNGKTQRLKLDSRVTLLDAVRDHMGLTGTKKGCDHGQCGACTVHVNGKRVLSCLTLAIACQGKTVTTIEGLAHRMQDSFIEHDAFQCGFCTPGQIMSAVALLDEPVGDSDEDVRRAMSGNICRCGAYCNIVDAIQDVRHGGVRSAPLSIPPGS